MKLLPEGVCWLVSLRVGACAAVFPATTAAWGLGVIRQPVPLSAVGAVLLAYHRSDIRQGTVITVVLNPTATPAVHAL